MLEEKKITTKVHKLEDLIALSSIIYRYKKIKYTAKNKLFKTEIASLQALDMKTISEYISVLRKIYNLNDSSTLKDDIASFAIAKPPIERLIHNLEQEFYKKAKSFAADQFTEEIFLALITNQYIIEEFNYELRNIFIYILENHLASSECMSENYKTTLKNILDNIQFKYSHNRHPLNIPTYEIEDYNKETLLNNYLHKLIDELIKTILSFKDNELENDIIYAMAIAYQCLLRSLLIILDNYELLAEYEALYNRLETKETMAKNIVKSAFISNYTDLSTYNKKKIKENNYE